MGLYGPVARGVLNSDGGETITIAAGDTVYSKAFNLKFSKYFALFYKAGSGGAVDLTIDLEQSDELPTTEGAAQDEWVVPESGSAVHTNLADTSQHSKSLSPVALPYGRLKIVSAAGVSNTLVAKLSTQEQF